MRRLLSVLSLGLGAAVVSAVFLVPVALAADPLPHTGRVLISTEGDISLPAGEHADVVLVINGTATILGEANTVVAIDGAANLLGARTETIVAIGSPIELGDGTVVFGDVMTMDSPIHRTGTAEVRGEVGDLAAVAFEVGMVLGPALFLLWIGFGLAMIVAGLLLAGIASRQVREAESMISRRPVASLAAGIGGLIMFPLVAFVLIATLVGAPLGIGLLIEAWPLVAFVGYLVAGIWIGDWVLRRVSSQRDREKPYLAALVGLSILALLAIVPVFSIVVAIASLFGFGAVLLLSLQKLTSPPSSQAAASGAVMAPAGGRAAMEAR